MVIMEELQEADILFAMHELSVQEDFERQLLEEMECAKPSLEHVHNRHPQASSSSSPTQGSGQKQRILDPKVFEAMRRGDVNSLLAYMQPGMYADSCWSAVIAEGAVHGKTEAVQTALRRLVDPNVQRDVSSSVRWSEACAARFQPELQLSGLTESCEAQAYDIIKDAALEICSADDAFAESCLDSHLRRAISEDNVGKAEDLLCQWEAFQSTRGIFCIHLVGGSHGTCADDEGLSFAHGLPGCAGSV